MERTVQQAIDDFSEAKRAENLSVKTLNWYRWLLEKFAASLSDQRLASLTLANARAFVSQLQARDVRYEHHPISPPKEGGLSDYTIAAYVRTLKVFGAWMVEEGYTKAYLFARLKRPKVGEPVIDVLSEGEVNKILATINPNTYIGSRNYAIVLLLMDTGIRASELCGLTLEHTDREGGEIKVLGKGKKERFVPFGVGTKRALVHYINTFRPASDANEVFLSEDGSPLTYNGLKLVIQRLADKSGVERLHLHLFRHTFAVSWLVGGGDLITLQKMLGHTTVSTTQLYLHLASAHVKVQHERYSPVDRLGFGATKRNEKHGGAVHKPHSHMNR